MRPVGGIRAHRHHHARFFPVYRRRLVRRTGGRSVCLRQKPSQGPGLGSRGRAQTRPEPVRPTAAADCRHLQPIRLFRGPPTGERQEPERVPLANRSNGSEKGEKRPGCGHRPDGRIGGRSHAAGGDRFPRRWPRADAGHQRAPLPAAGSALAGARGMAGGGLDPDPGFRHRHRIPIAIRQSGPADCRGGFCGQTLCGF